MYVQRSPRLARTGNEQVRHVGSGWRKNKINYCYYPLNIHLNQDVCPIFRIIIRMVILIGPDPYYIDHVQNNDENIKKKG